MSLPTPSCSAESWRTRLLLGLILALPAVVFAAAGPTAPAPAPVPAQAGKSSSAPLYTRDIRPILAENCFACHGPDKAARKGDLRLDIRAEAVKAEAFVPGKPEKSALVERVFTAEKGKLMPPVKSHKTLTPAQKDVLRRWVAEGAEYQPH